MADEIYSPDPLMIQESLEEWVMTKCEDWRDYYESNYEERFEEYYRLWRGQWIQTILNEDQSVLALFHLPCNKP